MLICTETLHKDVQTKSIQSDDMREKQTESEDDVYCEQDTRCWSCLKSCLKNVNVLNMLISFEGEGIKGHGYSSEAW